MPKLYIPDIKPYADMVFSDIKSVSAECKVGVTILDEYSGWTLVHMIKGGKKTGEITITLQPNKSLHVLYNDYMGQQISRYILANGTVLDDLGGYAPSMLAQRELKNANVNLVAATWAKVFVHFAFFKPETVTIKDAGEFNRNRAKGTAPITTNDYIFKLTPEKVQYIRDKQKELEEDREKRTNRYHMTRGHFRHYKTGKVVWVKAHYKGDKSKGIINKDYQLTTHQ